MHTGEVSDIGNWIQFGTDWKDWKCKDLKLKWRRERIWLWGKISQLDMEVKSDWMFICFTFFTKSPRKGLIVIEKLGKARNKNGEENNPLNKLHQLIVRICVNYTVRLNVLTNIKSSYVQNMLENMALTSYSDNSYLGASWGGCRKHANDVVWQVFKHKISEQFLSHDKTILLYDIIFMLHWGLCYTMNGKQVDAMIDAFLT